ncbi:MAG: MBL fold metallo-hydrolase [Desulfobacteraceae bacterium 4572_88]|nr:MAG: MBL fold metallo-hydrolase [Desulfobacteraceae bacterium 4572_88]
MKIHHLRNATFVIESGANHILIDPMLSEKGALPPFAHFRHKPERNPTVSLPDNASQILDKVTHCLITHSQKLGIELLTHTDHLDSPGKSFLRKNRIPVACRQQDAAYMKKNGISVEAKLNYWQAEQLLGGQITAVPALHGHSWTHCFMANGAGFYLELPDEPSIYISGDTVYTDDVDRALNEFRPDIAVVAAGCASLDVGGHILMPSEEIMTFIRKAPNKVVANHLESLNHCPATRSQLKQELERRDLLSKTLIPHDGETVYIA